MVRRPLALFLTVALLGATFAGCSTPPTDTTSGGVTTTTVTGTTTQHEVANVTTTTDAGHTTSTADITTTAITTTTGTSVTHTTATVSGSSALTTSTTAGTTKTSVSGSTTAVSPVTTTTQKPAGPAPEHTAILPGTTAAGTAFATLARAPMGEAVTVTASTKQFGRFLLTTSDNRTLPFNVACHIAEERITALLPADVDLSAIKPNFIYYGHSVIYNGAELFSRSTVMDLTQDATLTLKAKDGTTRQMTVHIEKLATGLPSMSLSTSGYAAIDSTKTYKSASFSVGGGNQTICAYATATQTKGADCSVKGRGNTSWGYDKKSYTLRFDTKYSLLGLRESKNYVLLALHADQSLLRYRLGEYLSERMGLAFTMNLRYVDLWLNGEYVGVYGLVEKIEVEPSRVNITDFVAGAQVNQMGYLLEFDDHLYANSTEADRKKWTVMGKGFYDSTIHEVFFYTDVLGPSWLTLRTTNAKNLTADHVNYIYAVVTKAMNALKSGDWATITAYMDVESFINWYLIEEYLNNTDSDMTSSVYMYIDVGGKLTLGPLWDLDNCAGNHTETADAATQALYDSRDGWFSYLFQCPEAKAMLKTRWAHMKTVLGGQDKLLDDTAAMLEDAATLNFARWNNLGTRLSSQPAAIAEADSYEAQVQYLKNFLAKRKTALDAFYTGL